MNSLVYSAIVKAVTVVAVLLSFVGFAGFIALLANQNNEDKAKQRLFFFKLFFFKVIAFLTISLFLFFGGLLTMELLWKIVLIFIET